MTVLTKLPVDQLFPAFAEPQVAEAHGLLAPHCSDLSEVLVMCIGGRAFPANDLPLQDNQPAEFDGIYA